MELVTVSDWRRRPGEIRVPFLYVPHGQTPPAAWLAAHPGAIRIPARMVPRRAEDGGGQQIEIDPEAMLTALVDGGASPESAASAPSLSPSLSLPDVWSDPAASYRRSMEALDRATAWATAWGAGLSRGAASLPSGRAASEPGAGADQPGGAAASSDPAGAFRRADAAVARATEVSGVPVLVPSGEGGDEADVGKDAVSPRGPAEVSPDGSGFSGYLRDSVSALGQLPGDVGTLLRDPGEVPGALTSVAAGIGPLGELPQSAVDALGAMRFLGRLASGPAPTSSDSRDVSAAESEGEALSGRTLHRGDDRDPATIFREGFVPRGASTDLRAYVDTNNSSAFVGTSKSQTVATQFAQGDGGHVYQIDPAGLSGVDVNMAYPANAYASEQEVAILGGVPRSAIVSAQKTLPGEG